MKNLHQKNFAMEKMEFFQIFLQELKKKKKRNDHLHKTKRTVEKYEFMEEIVNQQEDWKM